MIVIGIIYNIFFNIVVFELEVDFESRISKFILGFVIMVLATMFISRKVYFFVLPGAMLTSLSNTS